MALLVLALAFLLIALPTAMVLFIGLLPTLVAVLVDATPRRYAARTVAGLNFVGVMPYVTKLWAGQNDIAAAGRLITDPFVLVIMFGAAAVGWIMFASFPELVAGVASMNASRRIAQLKQRQAELIDEWGEAIAPQQRHADGAEQVTRAIQQQSERAA
jgi:hypothetical protein